MLKPITRRYHDMSVYKYFQFEFYCDRCGSNWTSEKYPFSLAEDKPKTLSEKETRYIIWKVEHDNAYERANVEAVLHFNKCLECGMRVCDMCYSELDNNCLDCDKK